MSLLYSSCFKYPDGEIRKPQEFSDLNLYSYHQQQPNSLNSSLSRFRSAPSSFFENLFNGDGDNYGGQSGAGVGCEEFRYFRSSSPEMDQLMGRFEPPGNGCGDSKPREELVVRPSIKHEEGEDTQMVYQSLPVHSLGNDSTVSDVGNSLDRSFSVMNSMDMENSIQTTKMSIGNGTNLVRQNSSPAGIFPDLGIDNGYTMVREAGSFRACNGETSSPTGRLSNHLNFSSGQRILPQISEMGEGIGVNGLDGNNKREYMTNFTNDFWDDSSSIDFKRAKDNNGSIFSALNTLDNQNGNTTDRVARLTHHWSLPKTMSEMATAEKFLQFQGSVPCKIRAKRGCATHPRSIAERVRRTRISERMRKLQELFPNMDKQTNTADMLDLAVEQIKELQRQVKTLNDTRTSGSRGLSPAEIRRNEDLNLGIRDLYLEEHEEVDDMSSKDAGQSQPPSLE